MNMRVCEILDCQEKHEAKGFCKKHYSNFLYSNSLSRRKETALKYKRTSKGKFLKLKDTTKFKNIEIQLTYEEYLEIYNKPCHYCSSEDPNNYNYWLARIDNNIGYLKDNLLPCCWQCNDLRGDRLTVEETLVVVKALLEYRKLKIF